MAKDKLVAQNGTQIVLEAEADPKVLAGVTILARDVSATEIFVNTMM